MAILRTRLLGTAIVLTLLLTMLFAGTSQAHPSTYCGHSQDGYVYYTIFHSHWNLGYVHIHKYRHYRYHQADGLEYLHTEQRSC